ncbi:MAG: hypothetical protein K8E24_013825, partial [Methanobacterium paludis]|nr:hypothetical protein [Methanobacterium paludis]
MTNKIRSPLENHKMDGKKLIPPLKQIPNLSFTLWTDRLPEYLYAALLTANLSQNEYLRRFRLMVEYFADSEEEFRPENLSLTSLGKYNQDYLSNALNILFDTEELKNILRPLLLFEELPAYSVWKDVIGSEPDENDWEMLKIAIGKTLYHQSQESTDIRWLCVVYQMACGKIRVLEDLREPMGEVWNYPYKGDLRKVRPTIRAMECSMSCLIECSGDWVSSFWDTCFFETDPEVLVEKRRQTYKIDDELSKRFEIIWSKLFKGFVDTLETSSVDAKHDASFGLAMYSLRILTETLNRNIGNYLIGRILLRSLAENY